jgi:thymidylate synthase (FAD)
MEFVKASAAIVGQLPTGNEILRSIEAAGRVSWKSEDKATPTSAARFVKMLIDRGHESVLEHLSVTVRFVVDRGVSHELVRHRIASFTQESTRYCNYQTKGIVFIEPPLPDETLRQAWFGAMAHAEATYTRMLDYGASPQIARSVLPNSLKTEVIMTANLREWRHIFQLRTAKAAHPQMREVMVPLLELFQISIPVVFEDIVPEV